MSTAGNQPPRTTPFEARPTEIDGLSIITMKQIEDERGIIRELFRDSALRDAGLTGFGSWKQINATETGQGAIRGLHAEEMWKLVAVVEGEDAVTGVAQEWREREPVVGHALDRPRHQDDRVGMGGGRPARPVVGARGRSVDVGGAVDVRGGAGVDDRQRCTGHGRRSQQGDDESRDQQTGTPHSSSST